METTETRNTQQELDMLVASGFAVIDAEKSQWWAKYAETNNMPSLAKPVYVWTPAGRRACYRYRHTTPMAWAWEMHQNTESHCRCCGCDTYKQQVWYRPEKGTRAERNQTVCLLCGEAGKHVK